MKYNHNDSCQNHAVTPDLAPLSQISTKFKRYLFLGCIALQMVLSLHHLQKALLQPAFAQFFNNSEAWMLGAFPEAGAAVPLVFNILRGVLVLYLGIALTQAVVAAREGEDVMTVGRTPLIVIVIVTGGDLMATLIHG